MTELPSELVNAAAAKADGPYRKPIAAPDPSGLLYGHHGTMAHGLREYDLFLSFNRALARTSARAAGRSANTEQLQDQVDQLKLLVHGLISYLQAQPNFDFAQFQRHIDELDAADGTLDGKITTPTTTIPDAETAHDPTADAVHPDILRALAQASAGRTIM